MKSLSLALVVIALTVNSLHAQEGTKPSTPVKTEPRVTGVEVVAKLAEQPTHIARTADGKIFTVLLDTMSQKARLVEVKAGGEIAAYPDKAWNAGRNSDGTGFSEIVGLKAGDGWLGIIDAGSSTFPPRVVVWDTRANKIVGAQDLAAVKREPGAMRFVQDLAVDTSHRCIYTVATSKERKSATLYVIDLNTKSNREFKYEKGALADAFVPADDNKPGDSENFRWGVNIPITIDPSFKWVYLGGVGGTEIFRVATAILSDPTLNSETLQGNMEAYGKKSVSSHITADDFGNVYCAEAATHKIGVFNNNGMYRTFLQDPILNFPYDLQIASDGYLYISVNQVNRLREQDSPTVDASHPFLIVRAKARIN